MTHAHPTTATDTPRRSRAQAGFSLIYIIVGMVLLAALSAGVLAITTSSTYVEIHDRYYSQARYAAMSGLNYIRGLNEGYTTLEDQTFEVEDENGNVVGSFTYEYVFNTGFQNRIEVEIHGVAAEDTAHEANFWLATSFTGNDAGAIDTDKGDAGRMLARGSDPNPDGSIPTMVINDDGEDSFFRIGDQQFREFSSLYFNGTEPFNFGQNDCVVGNCEFEFGFRAFYTVWYERNDADGLTLIFFQGDDNTIESIGGDSRQGEMIGYAGDGRVTNNNANTDSANIVEWIDAEGDGVQPPKFGFEFDNFGNQGRNICNGPYFYDQNMPSSTRLDVLPSGTGGGSNEDKARNDHVAIVGWGLDIPYHCYWDVDQGEPQAPVEAGAKTYDDNTHSFMSHYVEPAFGYTDVAPSDDVNMIFPMSNNDDVVRMGYAITVPAANDMIGTRDTFLNNNLYITGVSFWVKLKGNPDMDDRLRLRVYNTSGDVGSTARPDGGPLYGTPTSYTLRNIFFGNGNIDGDGANNMRNSDWRLVTFFLVDSYAENEPDNRRLVSGGDYAFELEYEYSRDSDANDTSNSDGVYIAVDKNTTWAGNLFYTDTDTGNVNTDATDTPLYMVHVYDKLFRLKSNSQYFPANDAEVTASDYYYYSLNASFDPTDYSVFKRRIAMRFEVDRSLTPEANGSFVGRYKYNLRAWFRACSDQLITHDCEDWVPRANASGSRFADLSGDLNVVLNPPALDSSYYLTPAEHAKFDTFYVGFQQATGGATQDAVFENFRLQFKRPFDTEINVKVEPQDAILDTGGGDRVGART